jgi:hypothetical protein
MFLCFGCHVLVHTNIFPYLTYEFLMRYPYFLSIRQTNKRCRANRRVPFCYVHHEKVTYIHQVHQSLRMSTSLLLSLHSQDASKHPKYDLMATQAVNLCSSHKNQNQSSQIWNVEGAIPLYFLQFTEWHWDKINHSYSVLLTKNAISEEEQGRTKQTHQKVVDGGMSEDWSFLSQPTLAVVSSCHLNHQELVQCSSISFF